MKRTILLVIALLLAVMSGCSSSDSKDNSNAGENMHGTNAQTTGQLMSAEEFEDLLTEQPLAVVRTEYLVQSEEYKSLYPDMLKAVLKNNTAEEIKDAVVAFAAWDENNLPVKIEGQFDFGDGSYIKRVNYSDINLIGGNLYGENSGYSINENSKIAMFKAIAVSFETFDGDTWENPYYSDFCKLYEGRKYSDDMQIEVQLNDSTFVPKENSLNEEDKSEMTAVELEEYLTSQPLTVIRTEYLVQSEEYKSLYPDMLQAVIKNNTNEDIKDAVVAFAAWDENNLPVKIEGQFDFGDSSYIKRVNYSDINLIAGATFGENSGLSLAENCDIKTFKAIVVSYETFNGETWENPYYDDFCILYEGKKLN